MDLLLECPVRSLRPERALFHRSLPLELLVAVALPWAAPTPERHRRGGHPPRCPGQLFHLAAALYQPAQCCGARDGACEQDGQLLALGPRHRELPCHGHQAVHQRCAARQGEQVAGGGRH